MHTKSSSRFLPILLCLGIIFLVAYLVIRHRATPSDDAVVASSDTAVSSERIRERSDDEPLRQEQVDRADPVAQKLAALESDVSALKHDTMSSPPSAPDAYSHGETEPVPLSTAEMDAQREQEENQLFSQIGDSFAAEPIDNSWSTSMAVRITEVIGTQPSENSSVESVECRSSVCRIEISVYDGGNFEEVRDKLRFGLVDELGAGASQQDETGRYIVYMAKDPQALGMTAHR